MSHQEKQLIVPGAGLNWNATSRDSSLHRPGYPASFFTLAYHNMGVELPGQQILDLGAGTGALALQFARQGSQVVALDPFVIPHQITLHILDVPN
jgi:2-polyprenyl-3-methyl-5-hydroxy-6-metoxy-1,4-benzoquinol methylase